MAADGSSYLERYTAGELSRDEERELAQAALRDQELFDALMGESAARAALRLEGVQEPAARSAIVASRRRWAMAALAAAAALAVLYPAVREFTREPRAESTELSTSAPPTTTPVIAAPVVLTSRLEDLNGASPGAFRSPGTPSRAPKREGTIASVARGEAVVAMGSVDGLVQGVELDVYRGADRGRVAGRVRVDAVFRETSRARATGSIRAGDTAVVPLRFAAAALRQRVVSLMSAGDAAGARDAAERAVPLLTDPEVRADDKRAVLASLGAIERRAGETDRAIDHLRAAVRSFDDAPEAGRVERTETLTELGAALLAMRQVDEAERVLGRARESASADTLVRVLNDLGAAAALRGDRAAAANLYRSALKAAGDSAAIGDERIAIGNNLAALSQSR